jgi:hypothetical protein
MSDEQPILRRALLDAGYSLDELRRKQRCGQFVTLRPGAYLPAGSEADHATRHRALLRATYPQLSPESLVSHASAAVLHGLPTWRLDLDRVHATRIRPSGARRDRFVHLRAARVEPDEVVEIDGFPVTSLARTVVDQARWMPKEVGVVLADAGLRLGLDPDELAEVLRRSARRPGYGRARRVVAFADGRSESVGESRSRLGFARAGLPPPVPQFEIVDRHGRVIGRVDFWWPEHGVVGEFDGKGKYGRLLAPGEDPAEVVYREKLREDALREVARTVVRWGWTDLTPFTPTADRLRRYLT